MAEIDVDVHWRMPSSHFLVIFKGFGLKALLTNLLLGRDKCDGRNPYFTSRSVSQEKIYSHLLVSCFPLRIQVKMTVYETLKYKHRQDVAFCVVSECSIARLNWVICGKITHVYFLQGFHKNSRKILVKCDAFGIDARVLAAIYYIMVIKSIHLQ